MSSICIIPARGGSKRIPRKNIKLFAGKPLIAHSIAAAAESGLFRRILVSTESEEIARVARDWGAETPFVRPAELADDHAGTDEVILHALDWLEQNDALPDTACCLYATAPFVTAASLRLGLETLLQTGAATAISVTHFPFPIFRALRRREDGRVEMLWPENLHVRSQDLPESFHDAGQFYWLQVGRYRKLRLIYNDDTVPVLLPRHEVQDIDTPEDWLVAERLFAARRDGGVA